MYYVYFLLSSRNNKIYTGYTRKHPSDRLKEHNQGSNQFTRSNGPFVLVYYEQYLCEQDALQREKFYKSGIGRKMRDAILVYFINYVKSVIVLAMQNNHVLVIYFDDTAKYGYPFDVAEYLESYATFCQLLRDQGVTPYIVRGADQYLGNMTFKSGWELSLDQQFTRIEQPIVADLIYRKGHNLRTEPGTKIINRQELEILCHDKLVTAEKLGQYMPMSLPVDSGNWQAQIEKIPSEKIVVKPVLGTEGRGIIVCAKADFNYSQLDPNWEPYLVQEFIDTSAGIPGLVTGKHDLRLYVFNGIVKMAEIREPKTGSYLANIAQGGTLFQVSLDKVPPIAFDFAQAIDQHLQDYWPRMYTVDMMFGPGFKPCLVELNSQSGLPYKDWEKFDHYYTKMHRFLLETLLSAYDQKTN